MLNTQKKMILFLYKKDVFFVINVYISLIVAAKSTSHYSANDDHCFVASVYEHHSPKSRLIKSPMDIVLENLIVYQNVAIESSKLGAKIIVFPEGGLLDGKMITSEILQLIPDLNRTNSSTNMPVNPCSSIEQFGNNLTDYFILKHLSCLARKTRLYMAINLGEKVACDVNHDQKCPSDGWHKYNTNILFDSSGNLLTKYRKSHLFLEPHFESLPNYEVISIDTPFGCLGMAICFDILFHQPLHDLVEKRKIDTLIFSAHWYDEYPFLAAHQVQNGISLSRQINLLASGINRIASGSLGSGIFRPNNGPLIYTHDIDKEASKLLIAQLPKSNQKMSFDGCDFGGKMVFIDDYGQLMSGESYQKISTQQSKYKPINLKLNEFNYTKLIQLTGNFEICHNFVCCRINYSIADDSLRDVYYLVVSQIIKSNTGICQQFCGLAVYDETANDFAWTSSTQFNYVQLIAKFSENNAFPSMVTNDLQLVNNNAFNFTHTKDSSGHGFAAFLSTTKEALNYTIVYFTLFSRCYERDELIL